MSKISFILRKLQKAICLPVAYLWNRYCLGKRSVAPPCYIVGCGNSGTSVCLAILGAHSRIHAITYESHIGAHPNSSRMLKLFDFMAIAYGKCRWVEKTPKNIYQIDKLLALRPHSKIIIMLRDGRDVAYSIRQRSGSFEKGVKRWVKDNCAGRLYWGHPQVMVVKYEELVTAFENTVARMLNFIGEEYEPACREFHTQKKLFYADTLRKPSEGERDHKLYRNWQINQPLFDGRGKWKKLSIAEKKYFKEMAGQMLRECGYVDNDAW